MKRRTFIKNAGIASVAAIAAPYILPSGRLFAATGSRLANHVVFVLFAGGLRNQEAVHQQFLMNQNASFPSGNIMNNMLAGAAPSNTMGIYNPISPILTTPLSQQGTLFKELRYKTGPTGHFNGHTTALTGNYTNTALNFLQNPDFPTVFEYYRKHTEPSKSAINAWWISENLGPYPALNYSRHPSYGAQYGANFLSPITAFLNQGPKAFNGITNFHPEESQKIHQLKNMLDGNFSGNQQFASGIDNGDENRQRLKDFLTNMIKKTNTGQITFPLPNNQMTGDLFNYTYAVEVMKEFQPELMVVNSFNIDVCHQDFSGYIRSLHAADYGVGWLWNQIQSTPGMANDTVMICMPEHGRNLNSNTVRDSNGLAAYDHTSDQNSREIFCLMVGPNGGPIKANNTISNVSGEAIDVIPTIAEILGFRNSISSDLLPGKVLQEAFV